MELNHENFRDVGHKSIMDYSMDKADVKRVRSAFRLVLNEAVPAPRAEQQELFTTEEERFISIEVDRKLYEPKLPNAGKQERVWMEDLLQFARDENLVVAIKAACSRYAAALERCLPNKEYTMVQNADGTRSSQNLPGCYYTRRPVTANTNRTLHKACCDLRKLAAECRNRKLKWLANFLLGGEPVAVSNFKMECLYILRNASGTALRLVRLVNTKGEKSSGGEVGGADFLPNEMYAGSEKFRMWVGSKGNFTWGGDGGAGNTELQMLQWDVTEDAAFRSVKLIETCGWHEIEPEKTTSGSVEKEKVEPGRLLLDGLWFFDECAIPSAGGDFILPDKDGIIWHNEVGYAFANKGREAEYTHARPRMQPGLKVDDVVFDTADWSETARQMYAAGNRLGAFFRETCQRFHQTAGGQEGYLTVGAALAYAAAPEIFAQRSLFPSVWINGQMGSGKTTYASWMMALQGFNVPSGLGVISKNVTAVGIMQQLGNYSNMMVWLDEYRESAITDDKAAILRDAYGRQLAAKWSPDGVQRKIRTTPMVTGESTTSDAATRSRFPHVLISEQRREGNHYEWMNKHRGLFFLFWRHLIQHRREYVALVLRQIEFWMQHPDLEGIPSRDKITHAVAFAGWTAATVMFESHGADEATEFRRFLMSHAAASACDVKTSVNVNVFVQELITAVGFDAVPLECLRVETEKMRDEFGDWDHYLLFIEPQMALNAIQIHLRKSGQSLPLRDKDLRDQLSKNPFWIRGKGKDAQIKKRFGLPGSKVSKTAWGIDVDLHPLGRQPVNHELFLNSVKSSSEKTLADIGDVFKDGDPRRGPLFSVVEAVLKWEKNHQ